MLQECFKPIEFSLKCCVPAEVYADVQCSSNREYRYSCKSYDNIEINAPNHHNSRAQVIGGGIYKIVKKNNVVEWY